MPRIIRFGLDDIALDHETVAASINRACRRTQHRVCGLCQTTNEVVFALEPSPGQPAVSYVLAPFEGDAPEDIAADIWSRWAAGFSTRGLIRLSASCLGLFEHPTYAPPSPTDEDEDGEE